MSTLPLSPTPAQLEAYIADQVAQAVAVEQQYAKDAADAREADHQRELRQAKRETSRAVTQARTWEELAKTRRRYAHAQDEVRAVLAEPLPRFFRGRVVRARLALISQILDPNGTQP